MLVYKGILSNMFKRDDRKDQKTGEIQRGKHQLEFLDRRQMKDSDQYETVLQRISIPDEKFSSYSDLIGQEVEVPVNYFVKNNQVILYGI